MISILNYGMGNLASIQNMFKRVAVRSKVIATKSEIQDAEALVIPGVGKFDNAIDTITALGIREAIEDAALGRKVPVLGICLGMQLMTRGSEEGHRRGFGIVVGEFRWWAAEVCIAQHVYEPATPFIKRFEIGRSTFIDDRLNRRGHARIRVVFEDGGIFHEP